MPCLKPHLKSLTHREFHKQAKSKPDPSDGGPGRHYNISWHWLWRCRNNQLIYSLHFCCLSLAFLTIDYLARLSTCGHSHAICSVSHSESFSSLSLLVCCVIADLYNTAVSGSTAASTVSSEDHLTNNRYCFKQVAVSCRQEVVSENKTFIFIKVELFTLGPS